MGLRHDCLGAFEHVIGQRERFDLPPSRMVNLSAALLRRIVPEGSLSDRRIIPIPSGCLGTEKPPSPTEIVLPKEPVDLATIDPRQLEEIQEVLSAIKL